MVSPNGLVLQSGGPTMVINKSVQGLYDSWRFNAGKLYGSLYGLKGLLKEDLIDFGKVSSDQMLAIANTPSATLGTARYNLRDKEGKLKLDDLKKIFEVFDAYQIGHVFIIGGDDSRENSYAILEYARENGIEITAFALSKTIDNDLTFTHHCPGFGSAAKFVVWAVAGIDLDNQAMPGAIIDVVMGRGAGWLAASAILARRGKDWGPHLIYVPEADFSQEKFLADIDKVLKKNNRVHLIVSEGVAEKLAIKHYIEVIGGEEFLRELCGQDAFGHPQLSGTGVFGAVLSYIIKKNLKVKRVRANTFDYPQRSFPIFSKLDRKQAYLVGCQAAELDKLGEVDNAMITVGEDVFEYNDKIDYVSLDEIFKEGRGKTKLLPEKVIAEGNNISDGYRDYLGPLIDQLPDVQTLPLEKLKVQK